MTYVNYTNLLLIFKDLFAFSQLNFSCNFNQLRSKNNFYTSVNAKIFVEMFQLL